MPPSFCRYVRRSGAPPSAEPHLPLPLWLRFWHAAKLDKTRLAYSPRIFPALFSNEPVQSRLTH
jgi:hypothetical protein